MAADTDDARVLEILGGARLSSRDPDVELAEMLLAVEPDDAASMVRVLTELVRDARHP